MHGGGRALNTASVLVRSGLSAAVVGKVGADPLGDFALQLLEERGVEHAGVVRDPATPTSASVVLVDLAGQRRELHLPGPNGRLRPHELDEEALSLGLRPRYRRPALAMPELDGLPTAAVLQRAKGRGATTSLDTVWDATRRRQCLVLSLPHVDLFVPSFAEAAAKLQQESAACSPPG